MKQVFDQFGDSIVTVVIGGVIVSVLRLLLYVVSG